MEKDRPSLSQILTAEKAAARDDFVEGNEEGESATHHTTNRTLQCPLQPPPPSRPINSHRTPFHHLQNRLLLKTMRAFRAAHRLVHRPKRNWAFDTDPFAHDLKIGLIILVILRGSMIS